LDRRFKKGPGVEENRVWSKGSNSSSAALRAASSGSLATSIAFFVGEEV